MPTPHLALPVDVEAARRALLVAITADPSGCRGCAEHAMALGVACRMAHLSGSVTYALLRESIGYRPRSARTQESVIVSPRDRLMLSAIDAFYGMRA